MKKLFGVALSLTVLACGSPQDSNVTNDALPSANESISLRAKIAVPLKKHTNESSGDNAVNEPIDQCPGQWAYDDASTHLEVSLSEKGNYSIKFADGRVSHGDSYVAGNVVPQITLTDANAPDIQYYLGECDAKSATLTIDDKDYQLKRL